MRASICKGLGAGVVMVALAFGLYVLLPETTRFAAYLDAFVRDKGVWGVGLYVLVTGALSAVAVPRQLLSFAGGFVFGPWSGMVLGTLGTTLGCLLTLLVARLLARDAAEQYLNTRYGVHLATCNRILKASPFGIALALRLFPSGSNWIASLLAGLSRVKIGPFVAGSAVGYIPQNGVFAVMGSGFQLADGTRLAVSLGLLCASILVTLLVLLKTPWGQKHMAFLQILRRAKRSVK